MHHHDYEQGKAVPLKMDEIFEKFQGGAVIFLSVIYVANFPFYISLCKMQVQNYSRNPQKNWIKEGGGTMDQSWTKQKSESWPKTKPYATLCNKSVL